MKILPVWFFTVVLLLTLGCLPLMPASPSQNQIPIAHIDSVSATKVVPGEPVAFSGHGIDPDGQVTSYYWRSSTDGELSTSESFQTSSLSIGSHTIWFKVQDNKGEWSNETSANVVVAPIGASPPVIDAFGAVPSSIYPGKLSTLSWQVTGAASVKIDPDIGSVSLLGNRDIYPTRSVKYTLTASNAAGTVSATTNITITSTPTHTVEVNAIASESGHVRRDGYVGAEINVGDNIDLSAMQAFLSFDISMIPKGAKVDTAFLDLTAGEVYGLPFALLGRLYIYSCSYTKLAKNDYAIVTSSGFIHTALGRLTVPITSSPLINDLQTAVDMGDSRFQVRLQFEKPTFNNREADYVSFDPSKPKLIVTYQD